MWFFFNLKMIVCSPEVFRHKKKKNPKAPKTQSALLPDWTSEASVRFIGCSQTVNTSRTQTDHLLTSLLVVTKAARFGEAQMILSADKSLAATFQLQFFDVSSACRGEKNVYLAEPEREMGYVQKSQVFSC